MKKKKTVLVIGFVLFHLFGFGGGQLSRSDLGTWVTQFHFTVLNKAT